MEPAFAIDVWGDVVCPYCYLGHRQLERALARFEHAECVVVRYRAFELDPRARPASERTLDELVARKYGLELAQVDRLHRRLEEEAAALGMNWSLRSARPTNTFDAHRLIALATRQGRAAATVERLFTAYFCDGALLSDHPTLRRLGDELGLADLGDVLDGAAYADEVRADEADAVELGISGVPTFLLDGRFLVSGAQSADYLVGILDRAWARRSRG